MSTTSNALTLSAAAPTKRQSYKTRPQNIIMQQVANLWQTLDATTQGTWQDLADSQVSPTVTGVRSSATAYGQFYIHNSTLINAGAPTITQAPTVRTSVPLPPVQLVITYEGNAPSLNLKPNASYAHSVILMGAKPLYANQNIYTKGAFKKIGSLPNLSLGNDITPQYLSKFRLPRVGYQVAIKLIGVSPDGTRTAPLFVAAVALANGSASIQPLVIE